MDLSTYVDNLRRELALAAEAGGDDARALAERLTAPLDSAVRLTLLDALSAAADEITRDLAPGSVELRLRGGEPNFAVTAPPVERHEGDPVEHATPEPEEPPMPESAGGATSRINFRPPENLKARIEEAAGREGRSVNAWLMQAAYSALRPAGVEPRSGRGGRSAQHFTGWVR